MNAYTRQDLSVMQAWPLERKIRVTQAKIIEWYHHYGGKVAVSFSGGKDSTVLLDLARRAFPDIPAVFVDTGLEYPEIREFVKTVPNVTWLRPEMPFSKVISEYGYPVISKDVARRIRYARKGGTWALCHLNGLNQDGTPSKFNERYQKWRVLLDAPFPVSDACCTVIKERPLHRYNRETGRKQIIATMACESARRQSVYLKIGCNAYHKRDPTSQPMSFWTEQDVLAYLQALYEKKLCTYPRTDSRFLTNDLEPSVPELAAVAAVICEADAPGRVNARQVCDSRKVSDHHAILPTASAGKADTSVLPLGEREILRLVAGQLLRAVSDAHRYAETAVTLECGGTEFTAKGRTTLVPGWKRYLAQEKQDAALPELSEGQGLDCAEAAVKEGKTTPPKHYTEDTLLSAMETAGKEVMPEEAERKGLGTPATRAAIIEKLVATGFVERKRAKKAVSLVPAHTGVSLITVLPEQLQSPLLTAEWEYRLQQVERGELSPDEFMTGIADMLTELVKTYQVISGAEVLFPSGREIIGKCPRCGSDVTESKKGFFCEKNDCRFGLWRDNKFFAAKRAALTKKVAAALLADGRVKLTGLYSEKTGGTYDATAVLEDTGESVRFRLEFDKGART